MPATVHNPFRDLRNKMGLSQFEIAKRAEVSKHAVLRLEQGCYSEPLPSLIDYYISKYPGISRVTLMEEYSEFQYQVRLSNARFLGDIGDSLSSCPVGIHPLAYLRAGHHLNPTELAKRLCVSQSTVVYFEKHSTHQKSVPSQIIKALHDAEYTESETDALGAAYVKYRKWLLADKQLTLVGAS